MPVSARADRRARFAELHARRQLFVLPNPWDVGSARLLEAAGFEALATTSAGFAWALGKLDHQVTRDALVSHVDEIAGATSVPLNVDSERCYPDDAGGISETVRRLSIEDYDPATERIDDVDVAVAHLKEALEGARAFDPPLVVTARAENHIRGVEVGVPVNVLGLPDAPPRGDLERVGVRRISTGSLLAPAAFGALVAAASEIREHGTWGYAAQRLSRDVAESAFGS